MNNHFLNESSSVFKTEAWVQAWLDTWGNNIRISLIDLGGRKNPLEYLYTERRAVKKIFPLQSLNMAGVGGVSISSPRAEYNDIDPLINVCGGVEELAKELKKINWGQFRVTDVMRHGTCFEQLKSLSSIIGSYCRKETLELSYQVKASDFNSYKICLGANTRLRYFNRRAKLMKYGLLELKQYELNESSAFFKLLNEFHVLRWGQQCYSKSSQLFMANFQERLQSSGGKVVMESMSVNGEVVSVIYDVIYAGKRYNFQSGYLENRFDKISLGAIHLGFSIESSVVSGQIYDFMAGGGKYTNYKSLIANQTSSITTLSLIRSNIKYLFKGYDVLKNLNHG